MPQPEKAEIAHVLMIDLVGYSLEPIEVEARLLHHFQEILCETDEFQRADGSRDLICLPTGDGVALVFFSDPAAAVRCAMEVAREVGVNMQAPIRMGIHSGPVKRVQDINGHENVAGAGINMAQRVMDCGDAGHILLSSTTADFLLQLGGWENSLEDLGECAVKHNKLVHLFSLHTADIGNPDWPERLRRSMLREQAAVNSKQILAEAVVKMTDEGSRVTILYKRNGEPDRYVLKFLETELEAHGYRVFIDRHLRIGMEWAVEIEKQIRCADAVIALLSEESVHSDMLECEIQIAHEASQQQDGKPQILPVRIKYAGPLHDPIAAYLDPIQAALWQSPDDDRSMLAEIMHALDNPPPPNFANVHSRLEPVGGAVPLDSKFYIERAADAEFRAAMLRQDSIVLVKGPRQIGKTSLLARKLQQARQGGARIVLTDFQKLNAAQMGSPDALFLTLSRAFADQLGLEGLPNEKWNAQLSANENFERFLRREVLGVVPSPVVWGLDEVDRLFTCEFGGEVFALFRAWHNERSLDPTGPWKRLTLAIAYATEAHLFITDLNQSPFNVGTRLTLEDFTIDQVAELNKRYGSVLRNRDELARFYAMVGGHPYLIRRGLNEMSTHGLGVAALESRAVLDEGPFGDHLHRILVLLARDPELSEIVRQVLQGKPCPTPDSFYRLRSAGLMTGDSQLTVGPRCEIYRAYLEHHLL